MFVVEGTISLGGADPAEVFFSTTLRIVTVFILARGFRNKFCVRFQSKFENYPDEWGIKFIWNIIIDTDIDISRQHRFTSHKAFIFIVKAVETQASYT
jgi:hypothetical protein